MGGWNRGVAVMKSWTFALTLVSSINTPVAGGGAAVVKSYNLLWEFHFPAVTAWRRDPDVNIMASISVPRWPQGPLTAPHIPHRNPNLQYRSVFRERFSLVWRPNLRWPLSRSGSNMFGHLGLFQMSSVVFWCCFLCFCQLLTWRCRRRNILLKFFSLRLFSTECVTLSVPAESAVCIFVYQHVILLLKLCPQMSLRFCPSPWTQRTAECYCGATSWTCVLWLLYSGCWGSIWICFTSWP